MSENFSLYENYRDEGPDKTSNDRAFGCTVGTILMMIGAAKAVVAWTLPLPVCFFFAAGVVLLLFGIVAPSRLSALNKLWSKLGILIAKVVNPIVLALLFFCVITPVAVSMRLAGKRPLRLAPDPAAFSYWIHRGPTTSEASSMRRQF